ncbi:hypothetical protein OIU79_016685, partial [Salix purpurea]
MDKKIKETLERDRMSMRLERSWRRRIKEKKEVAMAEKMVKQALGSNEVQKEVTLGDAGGVVPEKSATVKVKDTLRLFNKFYLQLVQEEELRCAKAKVDIKVSQGSKEIIKGSKKSSYKS